MLREYFQSQQLKYKILKQITINHNKFKIVNITVQYVVQNYYYTLNQGKTIGLTFFYFLINSLKQLDEDDLFWRDYTRIFIDNTAYHRSKEMIEIYQRINPYSYQSAPEEFFFQMRFEFFKLQGIHKKTISFFLKQFDAQLSILDTRFIAFPFYFALYAVMEQLWIQDF